MITIQLSNEHIEGLLRYVEWHGGAHVEDCPGDDTCDCAGKPLNEAVNAICARADAKRREQREQAAQGGTLSGYADAKAIDVDTDPLANRPILARIKALEKAPWPHDGGARLDGIINRLVQRIEALEKIAHAPVTIPLAALEARIAALEREAAAKARDRVEEATAREVARRS